MSDQRFRIFVVVAIALAAGLLGLGVARTNTDDDPPPVVRSRPDVVEHLIPRNGAEVLRQAEFGVDLGPGYEGRLVVGDVEIPEQQLRIVPEQNQVFFTPGEGKAVEELPPGKNCVTVIAWRTAQGRGVADQRFSWCFDVT